MCPDSRGAAGHFQCDADGKQRSEAPEEEFEVNPLQRLKQRPVLSSAGCVQLGLSEMGIGAGLCVWLATDEKLGDPPQNSSCSTWLCAQAHH